MCLYFRIPVRLGFFPARVMQANVERYLEDRHRFIVALATMMPALVHGTTVANRQGRDFDE